MNYREIKEGINGSGSKVWIVQGCRVGSKGQSIYEREEFATLDEAENWFKWCGFKGAK